MRAKQKAARCPGAVSGWLSRRHKGICHFYVTLLEARSRKAEAEPEFFTVTAAAILSESESGRKSESSSSKKKLFFLLS